MCRVRKGVSNHLFLEYPQNQNVDILPGNFDKFRVMCMVDIKKGTKLGGDSNKLFQDYPNYLQCFY